jgi:hypothetical protein
MTYPKISLKIANTDLLNLQNPRMLYRQNNTAVLLVISAVILLCVQASQLKKVTRDLGEILGTTDFI